MTGRPTLPPAGPRVGIVEGWEIRRARKRATGGGVWRGAAIVVLVLGALVVGGWLVARPAIGSAVTNLFVDNPSIVRWPIVSDLLHAELGDRLNKPAGTDETGVRFVIEDGDISPEDPIGDLEAALMEQGFVTDSLAFRLLMIEDRVDQLIRPGIYTLSQSMSPAQVVAKLTDPDPPIPVITLALQDGRRIEQVVALLQKMKQESGLELDVRAFRELALSPDATLRAEYPFLRFVPEGNSLEGFLGGGVWEIPLSITADELIRQLLDNWDARQGLLVAQARRQGVNFYEALIVASLVERETPTASERARVAGVYWNRLDRRTWGETAGFLNADPTVIYAADTLAVEDLPLGQWPQHFFWAALDRSLSEVQVPARLASFQTYQNKGLPDWPIATPSQASLEAALEPNRKKSLLYFYSCPGTDTHRFSRTLNQQQRNIARCS